MVEARSASLPHAAKEATTPDLLVALGVLTDGCGLRWSGGGWGSGENTHGGPHAKTAETLDHVELSTVHLIVIHMYANQNVTGE